MRATLLCMQLTSLTLLHTNVEGLTYGGNNVCYTISSNTSCGIIMWGNRICTTRYYQNLFCCEGWATELPTSESCDIHLRTCDSNPCQNGGTCANGRGMYNCSCPEGREGDHCEIDITVCNSNPCQNGGRCEVGPNVYLCSCNFGWSGTNCEFDITPPTVDQCPENITEFTSSALETVHWDHPEFSDIHGTEVYLSAQNYPDPQATLPWGEYNMQYVAIKPINGLTAECSFTTSIYPIPCPELVAPTNGSIACNGWNSRFGAICTLFCESNQDLPVQIDIEEVYMCGASGAWIPRIPSGAQCSELRTSVEISSRSEEQRRHYYGGHCSNGVARNTIAEAYITILRNHRMSDMCTNPRFAEQCIPDNVYVICN